MRSATDPSLFQQFRAFTGIYKDCRLWWRKGYCEVIAAKWTNFRGNEEEYIKFEEKPVDIWYKSFGDRVDIDTNPSFGIKNPFKQILYGDVEDSTFNNALMLLQTPAGKEKSIIQLKKDETVLGRKPGRGWHPFASLRKLAESPDGFGGQLTDETIKYHLKKKHTLWCSSIRTYEKQWYLFTVNKDKIIKSLQSEKQRAKRKTK